MLLLAENRLVGVRLDDDQCAVDERVTVGEMPNDRLIEERFEVRWLARWTVDQQAVTSQQRTDE